MRRQQRFGGGGGVGIWVLLAALAGAGPASGQQESWAPPIAKDATARRGERDAMVKNQIAQPSDGRRPITHPAVLEALRAVPRHVFVPAEGSRLAYEDAPLAIGHGQTISQPYIVALMTDLLELTPQARVLEIGTGSGYQAAVLAHLTPQVYTLEIIEPLAERAADALRTQGYTQVNSRTADGYFGWPEAGPFDAIIVTCAAGHLPPALWDQLKPGGRIVVPIGGPYEVQRLVLISKGQDGAWNSKTITSVRFVPLTREAQQEAKPPAGRP